MNNGDAIKTQVKGFLEPIFIETSDSGENLNGLDPQSFEMVRQGFACAKCLAIFDTYTITCPVCGLTRDLAHDMAEAPSLWQQHINERNQDTPTPRRRINPAEEIQRMGLDRNVEQIPLSKLKPKRR